MAKLSKRGRKAPPQTRRKPLAPKKALASRKSADASLKQQLAEARAQKAATAAILKAIARSPSDVQPVLDAIAKSAARLCVSANVSVMIRDGDVVRVRSTYSREAGARPPLGHPIPIRKTLIAGRAVLRKRTVHVRDAVAMLDNQYPDARENQRRFGFRSVLAVPMLHKGDAIGVLYAWRRDVRPYTRDQVALLESFADQAVIAIENVRLFNETKEALERQTATAEILGVISGSPNDTQPVFDAIAGNAARVCDGLLSGVFRFDGSLLHFAAHRNFTVEGLAEVRSRFPRPPAQDNLGARSVLDRAVVHIPDVEADPSVPESSRAVARAQGYRSLLAVPMLRDGRPLGFIAVGRAAGGFSAKQIELLKIFADQAVIAIENVRLFNETKEALERQTATAEILSVIASSPSDVQPVFDSIAASALRLCDGSFSVVSRFDGQVIHLAAFSNLLPEHEDVIRGLWPMQPGRSSATARAISEAQVIQIPDALEDREYRLGSAADTVKFRSVLAVPMLRDGVPIGVINVNRQQPGVFPAHQVTLLKTFADQAVIAIENVRLFNETKEALERQTATAEILNVIASSPANVQPVFDAIVQSAARLFDRKAALRLVEAGGLRRRAWSYSMGDEFHGAEFLPLNRDSLVGTVALECKALQFADSRAPDAPLYMRTHADQLSYRSVATAPLVRDGAAIGVITVSSPNPGALSEKQMALLKTFADQAVIAIQNVRLFNETKEALERQTATAEILKVISGSPTDVQPVLNAIVQSATRLFVPWNAAIVMREGNLIHLRASAGPRVLSEEEREASQDRWPLPFDPENSVSSRVIADMQSIQILDTEAPDIAPGVKATGRAAKYRSIVWVPLARAREGIGCIALTHAQPGYTLSEKQLALTRTFADQAVIAIENVRLFNETKEALERQTATAEILKVIASSPSDVQPVFEAIAERAAKLIDSPNVTILMKYGAGLRVRVTYTREEGIVPPMDSVVPIDETYITGRAFLAGRTSHIEDVVPLLEKEYPGAVKNQPRIGYRTVLAVPMIGKGEAIGVIYAWRREVRKFSPEQVALLESFADQAVIAIENVRLFNETKEALERQTATAEILKVISSSLTDTQPVFEAIARSVVRLCDGLYAYLGLYDGKIIDFVAFHNVSPQALAILKERFPSAPIPGSSTGRAILGRMAIHIPDVMADAEYSFKDLAHADGYRAILAVPMLRDGTPIGVIAVGRRTPFSEDQIELVKIFADQAVIAIENVRLFKELQSRTEALTKSVGQLTALGEVGQAISSTLDLETVLHTIVQRAVQLTGLDGGSIYEYDESREEFRLQASDSQEPELLEAIRRAPIRKGDGTVGGTAVTFEATQVPDILDASYQSSRKELLIRAGYRAILTVPLLREDRVIGALSVTRKTPGPFAPEVVELLKTFATQSAMAIQNARLFREIAEKGKQLEEASQHKSNFLASMSHELRTPLNAILGFNEMILDQVYGEVSPEVQAPLENIQTSGKHLLRLINNVLDLAKIEAGRMELSLQDYSVHDAVASVQAILRPLAAEKGLEFLATLPDDLPLAYGDSGRIAQCLMNLAGNSLKFTKAGKVEISADEKDGLLTYRVTDTGVGIPADKIGSLFTEFKQTDATIASEYGGTGLGLSISRKFVEMHGGRIWVESELGKGSAFIIEIPLRVKTP